MWCVAFLSVAIVAEADRTRSDAQHEEAKQLEEGFAGSVEHASCSYTLDEMRIRAEIGTLQGNVDKTISVLLHAGMSTARLRDAHDAGVNVKRAGHIEWAPVITSTLAFLLYSREKLTMSPTFADVLLVVCGLTDTVTFLTLVLLAPLDVQAFGFKCAHKCGVFLNVLNFICAILQACSMIDAMAWLRIMLCFYMAIYFLLICIVVLRVDRIANIPYGGRWLAQCLIAPCKCCNMPRKCVSACHEWAGYSADSDNDSDNDSCNESERDSASSRGSSAGDANEEQSHAVGE